jgi:hypothetical protein
VPSLVVPVIQYCDLCNAIITGCNLDYFQIVANCIEFLVYTWEYAILPLPCNLLPNVPLLHYEFLRPMN